MEIFGKTPFNPLVFYTGKIAGYIVWAIACLFLFDLPFLHRYSFGWNDSIATVLFLFGFGIFLPSLFNLGKSVRFGLPTTETTLKTYGIYKISRNPMYLAFGFWTVGAMILILKFCVIILGTYSIIVYHYIILAEEKFLSERFGQDYEKYKIQVNRYI